MIRLVVLDVAGTTVDEGGAVYVALRDAVAADPTSADRGVPLDAMRRWMGVEKRAAIRGLSELVSHRSPTDDAVERMYRSFRDRLAAAYDRSPPVPMAGVPEALDRLRSAGVRVALTTGFGRDIADPLLASLGWTASCGDPSATVDAVVTADEVPLGRPAPYLVFRAMERTLVTSVDEVLVAGDTLADLASGTNAGARLVVGVTTGDSGRDELAAERHTHILPSAAAIPELLGLH